MPETRGSGARRYTTTLPGLSRRRHQSRGEERWLGHPSDSREYKDKGATVNREIDLAGHTCQEDQLNKENKGETHA